MNPDLSFLIKEEANRIGFTDCGISKADFLSTKKTYLCECLENKYHSQMNYMENHLDKRLDPRVLFEGAKSVVVVSLNYYNDLELLNKAKYKISKYAWGKDYHLIIKNKLYLLQNFIKQKSANCKVKVCVDTAPVMEKVWAEKSGIGWIGKNTCHINKKNGSFHFLGELILDIELEYDKPSKNYCGNCNKCVDACPTNALEKPYCLNANNCISYLTIESKKQMSDDIIKKSKGWIFGCDICQDVCPWNKIAKPNQVDEFKPMIATIELAKNGCKSISNEEFNNCFKESAIYRADYNVIKKNIEQISSL